MYTMSALTKSNVERVTGVTIEEMKNMTMNQERDLVKKRNEERLTFSKNCVYFAIIFQKQKKILSSLVETVC